MRYNYDKLHEELVVQSLANYDFKSRARRSLSRLKLYPERALARLHLKTMKKISEGFKVRTMHRDLVIVPSMVNQLVNVHDGKNYIPLKLTEDKVGLYLGTFVSPKKVVHNHTSKTKDKKGLK